MRRTLKSELLIVLMLLFTFSSNVFALSGKGIIAILYKDLKPGEMPTSRNSFGEGEQPTIYVFGYENETIVLRLYSISDNKIIQTREPYYVPNGMNMSFPFNISSTGTYQAQLLLHGALVENFTFTVYRDGNKTNQNIPEGLYIFNKWQDLNNDKIMQIEELFGLNRKTFNLDKEELCIFYQSKYKSDDLVTYQVWSLDGNKVSETISKQNKYYYTGPGGRENSSEKDFIDKLYDAGQGGYRIVVIFKGLLYAKEINIERGK